VFPSVYVFKGNQKYKLTYVHFYGKVALTLTVTLQTCSFLSALPSVLLKLNWIILILAGYC